MRRIQDRYPAKADPLGTRRKPHRADGGDDGILDGFRHRHAPKAVACLAFPVGEYGKMTRRFFEPGELEGCVVRSPFARVRAQRFRVAGLEILDHGAAS